MESEYFLVYHRPSRQLEAARLLETMEHYRQYVEELTGGYNARVSIMIEDTGVEANGLADVGNNKISLFSHFPTDGSLAFLEDWWSGVGVHEYIHILQIGQDSGAPRVMRLIFGDSVRVNAFLPMWMIEGITVYGESNFSPYSGRLKDGYYPGIVASLAHHNKLPSAVKGSYLSDDTPLSNYYVLGGAFYSWLAGQYGAGSFAEFYALNGKSFSSFASPILPGLGIDKVARQVYGKSFPQLWEDWRQDTKQRYVDLKEPQVLHSNSGYNKTHLRAFDGRLYYTQRHKVKTGAGGSYSETRIMRYDPHSDSHEMIHRQASGFPAGYQVTRDKLYYSRYRIRRGYPNTTNQAMGYEVQILARDLDGSSGKVLAQGNIRGFLSREDGSFLYCADKEGSRGSQLFCLEGDESRLIWESDGHLLHDIFENLGRLYLGAREHFRNSSIYEFDGRQLIPVVDTPYQERLSGFWGDRIIYTANYEKQSHSYVRDPLKQEYLRLEAADYMTDAVACGGRLWYLAMQPGGLELASDPIEQRAYSFKVPPGSTPPYDLEEDYTLSRQYTSVSAFWPNLKHLLVPRRYRMPLSFGQSYGIGLAGTDLLGYIPWWDIELLYNTDNRSYDFGINISNDILMPLRQDIGYSTSDGGVLDVANYFSLYRNNNFGINQIDAGLGFETKEGFARKIWRPYLSMAWSAFGQRGYTELYSRVESMDLTSSDRDRFGFGGYHSLRQLLPGATDLSLRLHWANDPVADTDEVFAPVFGYGDGIDANRGFVFQGSLNHLLFKVREGLWNPQVYIEDVGGGLFFELGMPWDTSSAESHHSYGAEIKVELSTFFRYSTVIGLRFGLDKKGNFRSGLNVNMF